MSRPTHRLSQGGLLRGRMQAYKWNEIANIIIMQTRNELKFVQCLHRMVIHIEENLLLLLRREPKELTKQLRRSGV